MRDFMNIVSEAEDLPMDDAARLARAKELGFTIPAFHGTKAAFNEFDVEKGKPSVMGGFAPHFSSTKAEAKGYAKKAKGARVLEVLLRVKKPLRISFQTMEPVSPAEYKKVTGKEWPKDSKFPPSGKAILSELESQIGWSDHRATWTHIYRVLMKNGYDALLYPSMMADHSSSNYDKYVVFDPKNVRLVTAAFDPAHAESRDLNA